ncbi:Actin-related protein 8 [Linum perenne]
MAVLLRKVWESVSNRPSPSAAATNFESVTRRSSSASSSSASSLLSLGFFDRLPIDVLVQIVRLVGPEDAARLSVASKSWRSLVSDNRLWIFFLQDSGEPWTWDSVFFAEMNLRSGYPLRTFPSHLSTELSLMRIYGERRKVPGAVIIDDTEAARASRRQLKGAIHTALFDMNVPSVCAVNQAVLALYAAHRTSGIVVNVGFQSTSVVPILNGKVMHSIGVEVIGIGALKVTGFLKEQMQQNNINCESLYTIRTLKENMCYVAYDYQAELRKDTSASLELPGEGQFTLSTERFKTGEILFQPRLAGVRTMGLHQAISLCMDHCDSAELTGDDSWFKTVVLSGGTACLPGLAERLDKEVRQLVHPSLCKGFKVVPPTYGVDTAWFGAKLVSNLSSFPDAWCVTKKNFKRKSRFHLAW